MGTTRRKWLSWLAALAVVAAVGGGFWYAHAQGWLAPAYHWVHHVFAKERDKSKAGGMGMNMAGMDMNMPGMDMNMPGMDMGGKSTGHSAKSSAVPGHAEVTIPGEIQQRIGVTVGRVEEGPLDMTVHTVGIVRPDETKMAYVNLRTEGWVEKLFVNYTGKQVEKGERLLAIYSREFMTTQQDYLSDRSSASRNRALRRLRLLGVAPAELKELARTREAQENLVLRSPIAGTVLTKNVLEGEYVTPGRKLYEVADLSTVWVQAKVYEYELPHVRVGQAAEVTVAAVPKGKFTGKVVFIQPTVEEPSRTVQVRIELPNQEGLFKPGMFADITLRHRMGKGLLVPVTAVIRTGERDLAYRVKSPGRFLPVEVKVGPLRYGNRFHVQKGLKAGEWVTTSANFLIDSESRLRAGGGGMAGMAGMDMGGMDMKGTKQPAPGKSKDHDHSHRGD